jgi:gliding motility-associated protein GldM
LATSEGKYDQEEPNGFPTYLGKNAFGRDTCVSLGAKIDGKDLISKKDEYQELTAFLVGPEPQAPKFEEDNPWSAHALKLTLEAYRDYLKAINFKDSEGVDRTPPMDIVARLDERFSFENEIEDGKEVLWEAANFYDVPLAAVMPLMSKIIIDVQDAEKDLMTWLTGDIDAKALKFTGARPIVIPQSSYILQGDTFRAEVLIAGFDPTNRPTIYVDEKEWDGKDSTNLDYAGLSLEGIEVNSDGIGLLKIPGNRLGEYAYKGVIRRTGPEGITDFPFTTPAFTVAPPTTVVSPTQLNVFYRGLPNPVEVSVPGVSMNDLVVNISSGHAISGSGGNYIVTPGKNARLKEAEISVSAKLPDGTTRPMGSKKFRVKRIPDPVPSWMKLGPNDNEIEKNTVLTGANAPVVASMLNFEFDVDVRVSSFTLSVFQDGNYNSFKSESNRFTPQMQSALSQMRSGSLIVIEDIKALKPDGEISPIGKLSLRIK